MTRRWICVCSAILMLVVAVEADEKKEPKPSATDMAVIAKQGFVVETGKPTSLSTVYRFGAGPHFVTADAGLAVYLALLRDVFFHLGTGWDREAGDYLAAWAGALDARAGETGTDQASHFVAVLRALYGGPSTPAIEATTETWRSADPELPWPEEGHPTENARYQVLAYVVTRVRVDECARSQLQVTMPVALREVIDTHFAWAGAARLVWPGTTNVLDMHLIGDRRSPPGVLAHRSVLPGLAMAAELGNETARRLLDASVLRGPEALVAPSIRSLRGRLDRVLRILATKPVCVPPLFRSRGWSALEMQTVLASRALFDRAVGAAGGSWDVFGADHPAGFVHPHPAFWRALAGLCRSTVSAARTFGIKQYETPPVDVIDRLEKATNQHLEDETPFTDQEIRLLRRCGLSAWDVDLFQRFGKPAYKARPEKARRAWLALLRTSLRSGRYSLLSRARRAASDRQEPTAVRRMEALVPVFVSLAEIAEMQLSGRQPDDLNDRLWAFRNIAHKVMSRYTESPLATCVPRLRDGPLALFQGCAWMDTLWIRYPWKGEQILCRGAVFSYREYVTTRWLDEKAWRELIKGDAPPARPPWSKAFVGATESTTPR